MAKLIKSYDVMSFGQSFSRLNGQPLDNTSIYYSVAEAEAYALLDKAYVGQPIAVIDEAAGKATLYVIGPNNNLEQVGALPDGLSLDLHEGKLELKGFNAAENNTLPMIENGSLVWKTLEDIGAGDGNDNTTDEESDCTCDTGTDNTESCSGNYEFQGEDGHGSGRIDE